MRARVACVDVRALPLQLLSRAHPEWRDAPLAVVEDDHPQAKVLWIDERAAKHRVRVGMRYASALQLSRHLRAAPVPSAQLALARRDLLTALQARTPRVEPDAERDGVFWLDPTGLGNLFGPLQQWAENVRGAVTELELFATVVVGFVRLPCWAIARSPIEATSEGVLVLASAAEEARLAGLAPLVGLGIEPELRDALLRLDIRTLAGFLALPRGEVGLRFGSTASRLHALFDDALRPPMQPAAFDEPIEIDAELDPPDDNAHRLLFCVKGALHALVAELSARALALAVLELRFELERADDHVERIEPARPTRDALAILELVRLRLGGVRLAARVERIRLRAEPARLDGRQLDLFAGRRRDPEAASRSIARLRAAFGERAVTRAALRDAWLPEERFAWEPTSTLDAPRLGERAEDGDSGVLIRRMNVRPERLPAMDGRPRTDPPLIEMTGPYRLQGGWWVHEVMRDYFFGERADGVLLWLFHDRRRDAWFLHGTVD